MKTLLVTPKDDKDFESLTSFLKRLGYGTGILYDHQKEDKALIKAMLEEKIEEYVSEDEIAKALGKKNIN